MIVEYLHKGKGNIMSLELRAAGAAANISGTSRAVVEFADIVVDSSLFSAAFDWTTNGANGQLDLTFGTLNICKGVPDGSYVAKVTLYDLTYPTGLQWGEEGFIINVD